MRFSHVTFSVAAMAVLAACSESSAPADAPAVEAVTSEVEQPETDAVSDGANTTVADLELAPPAPVESVMEGIRAERVSFDAGANSASVEGSITGYDGVDYVLNVREGQALNISMATQSTAAYFNVLEPDQTAEAVFIGSTVGNQFEGVAAKSGDYRIRVYQMRSAARRDETADYRLEMIVD